MWDFQATGNKSRTRAVGSIFWDEAIGRNGCKCD